MSISKQLPTMEKYKTITYVVTQCGTAKVLMVKLINTYSADKEIAKMNYGSKVRQNI